MFSPKKLRVTGPLALSLQTALLTHHKESFYKRRELIFMRLAIVLMSELPCTFLPQSESFWNCG